MVIISSYQIPLFKWKRRSPAASNMSIVNMDQIACLDGLSVLLWVLTMLFQVELRYEALCPP